MWKVLQAIIVASVISIPGASAQKNPKADDILREAKVKAVASNKTIFLIFGASWCEACHQLDAFLALPDIAPIFEKYFIVAKISFGEGAGGHPSWDSPGSDSLMAKYGGVSPQGEVGLPFIAVLDQKAKLMINSNIPGRNQAKAAPTSTGFATEPEEIKWFLTMIRKGAPGVSEDETLKIEEALQDVPAE
jgi:hypothetical protein